MHVFLINPNIEPGHSEKITGKLLAIEIKSPLGNSVNAWVPSISDLFSEDWEIS